MNTGNISATVIGVVIIIVIVALLFVNRFNNNDVQDPHTSSVETTAIEVSDYIPNFQLLDVHYLKLIPEIFLGDPTIIWFATSKCVPCQIGAREISKLDDELGGDAFDVLVVFVDLEENREDLIEWRDMYGNPDWLVAFDDSTDSLAEKLGVRFPDTKYLLDGDGAVRNIDVRQVTSSYVDLLRYEVAGG